MGVSFRCFHIFIVNYCLSIVELYDIFIVNYCLSIVELFDIIKT